MDNESDDWIPPSHGPFNNEVPNYLNRNELGEQSHFFESELIDLDKIDLDVLIKAQQRGESEEDFIEIDDEMSDEEFEKLIKHIEGIEKEFNYGDDSEESLELQLQTIEEQIHGGSTKNESSVDMDQFLESSSDSAPKWLQTRQKASLQQHESAIIEIKHHTLLNSDEIIGCLNALGGIKTKLIQSKYTEENLFVDGMIVVTGHNTSHLRTMSNAIVKALKDRKLAEKDVIGAKYGAEDGDDWIAIDAGNYLVHIMDEVVRRNTNLEKLWGDKEIDEARNLDFSDEDKLEDYIKENPISDEYASTFFKEQEYGRYTGGNELGKYKFQAWEEDMKRKERQEKLKRKVSARKKK